MLMTRIRTDSDDARERLDAILSDRLLWFNPYRVADRPLIECAERGRCSPFPSLTQMLVFHFHDIQAVTGRQGISAYSGIFFHIGDSGKEHHFGVGSLSHPMTHMVTRKPVWTLINGRHMVSSSIHTLERKDVFISHAINCDRPQGGTRQAYRMHRLPANEAKRADVIRRRMCEAKIAMLEEVLRYAAHPDYLANPSPPFDYATPILRAMESIRRFPYSAPPAIHVIS